MLRWTQELQDEASGGRFAVGQLSGPRSTHDERKRLRVEIDALRAAHRTRPYDRETEDLLVRAEEEYVRLGGKLGPR